MKNVAYLLSLQLVDGLGRVSLQKLLDHFQDPKLIWQASAGELKTVDLSEKVISNLALTRQQIDPLKYHQQILNKGINILTLDDPKYPELLKNIYDPPQVIYYKGQWPDQIDQSIGVVGTRRMTSYGKSVTETLVEDLVAAGMVIVSGLARGIDTVAHQTAVQNHGQTIAVLGSGLENIYPIENTHLAEQIIDSGGVVISEYPPSYSALASNFPVRNRIISGLSLGVLVIEADEGSGSLITARNALDQSREVWAVPGPITSRYSIGPINLIKQGATPVISANDILESLGLEQAPIKEQIVVSGVEQQILELVDSETRHIDEIVRLTQKQTSEISSILIKMEIIGLVKNLGGGRYIRS